MNIRNGVGVLVSFFALCPLWAGNSVKVKSFYGAPISLKKAVPLKQAIAEFSHKKDKDKEILVQAQVEKVCQSKGCWMVLKDNQEKVRVTFKDYGFFVPSSLIGQKVLVQGKLNESTLSVAEAQHYAEDAGKSKEEIDQIKEPQKEYRFVASGVKPQKD